MASFGAKLGRDAKENNNDDISEYVPEGVEAMVPYRGKTSEVIYRMMGGFRSGMSYCGARSIEEMRGKGDFIRITQAGMRESMAHDVNLV